MGKRTKKRKKIHFWAASLIIFCLGFLLYAFLRENFSSVPSIYVFPENPKQGDTVSVKVKGRADKISGNFNGENIDFLRLGEFSGAVAFLGIDVKMEPAEYKIFLNVSGKEIEKTINVEKRDFPVLAMPITEELEEEGFTEKTIVENIEKKDTPALNKVLTDFTSESYFKKSFSFPLSKMEIKGFDFGTFVKAENYQLQHLGVDLKVPSGTKVFAVNDGKVVLADELFNYGKTMVIDHGLKIFSMYLHLSDFKVSLGEKVKRGQPIALSGSSGYSTAPHLHFSMRDGKSRIDPILFIEATRKTEENILASIGRALLRIFNIAR